MGASGVTPQPQAVTQAALTADVIPRPPSGPGEEGDAVLPGQRTQPVCPRTMKCLGLSPAGVCLVLASLRRGCSHLHLTVSLPGSPELLH